MISVGSWEESRPWAVYFCVTFFGLKLEFLLTLMIFFEKSVGTRIRSFSTVDGYGNGEDDDAIANDD